MEEATAIQGKPTESPSNSDLYPPSWVDRFLEWARRLPGPPWLFYVGWALVLVCAELVIQWTGGQSLGAVSPFHIAYVSNVPYLFWLIHHLDNLAADALKRFRPAMEVSDAEYAKLHYQLTTMPARPVLLTTILGLGVGVVFLRWVLGGPQADFFNFVSTPLSLRYNQAVGLALWVSTGPLAYHTLHQMRHVSHIYTKYTNVNLYDLRPLYAFSILSARTAIGWVLFPYLWLITSPPLFIHPAFILVIVITSSIAVAVFLWPLIGVHQVLEDEKGQLLAKNAAHLKAASDELHQCIAARRMTDMDNVNKALASLELEHTALARISTWPWKSETLHALFAALLFPVVVWLTQWVLGRFLGE